MFVFSKIRHALFSWNTRLKILLFALLPTVSFKLKQSLLEECFGYCVKVHLKLHVDWCFRNISYVFNDTVIVAPEILAHLRFNDTVIAAPEILAFWAVLMSQNLFCSHCEFSMMNGCHDSTVSCTSKVDSKVVCWAPLDWPLL